MTIGSFLMLTIFPALLPPAKFPKEEDNFEYYEVLGLNTNNSTTPDKLRTIDISDIRKAYRKKSLQLHPDKIAQRRNVLVPEQQIQLQKEYEKVQEAYSCLQDTKLRTLYHDYNCSVLRYRFVTGPHPELYNPIALGENLTKYASITDKTRIMFAVVIIMILFFLQPILISIKINDKLESISWVVLLIPWWIAHGFIILLFLLLIIISKLDKHIICTTCEIISWLIGIVLLANEWDNNNNNNQQQKDDGKEDDDDDMTTNWHQLAIPFYIAVGFRIIASIVSINSIRTMQSKMISLKHLEKKVLSSYNNNSNKNATTTNNATTTTTNNNANNDDIEIGIDTTTTDNNISSLEDLPEEQQIEIMKQYIIVHNINEEKVEAVRRAYKEQHISSPGEFDELDEEEIEEAIRVQTSDEYTESNELIQVTYRTISKYVIFYLSFILLVSYKLTYESQLYDTSWWIIFIPIWCMVGIPLLFNCCLCCCISGSNNKYDDDDEIIIINEMNQDDKNDKDNNKEIGIETNNPIEENRTVPTIIPVTNELDNDVNATTTTTKNDNDDSNDDVGSPPWTTESTAATKTSIEKSVLLFAPPEEEKIVYQEKITTSGTILSSTKQQEEKIEEENNDDDKQINIDDSNDKKGSNSMEDENKKDGYEKQRIDEVTTMDEVRVNKDDGNNDNNPDKNNTDEKDGGGGGGTDRTFFHNEQDIDPDIVRMKGRACFSCCWYAFQMMILCLLVGKLDADYDEDVDSDKNQGNDDDDDDGYNTLWILFPIFIVCVIMLCFCFCLIYGTDADHLDDIKNQKQGKPNDEEEGHESNTKNNNEEVKGNAEDQQLGANMILTPPPPLDDKGSTTASTSPPPPPEIAFQSQDDTTIETPKEEKHDSAQAEPGITDTTNARKHSTAISMDELD